MPIHLLQGVGYNVLEELGARNVPTQFFLHDLALACVRAAMFKKGSECKSHCLLCRLSTAVKRSQLSQVKNLTFAAPSKATLTKMSEYIAIQSRESKVLLNANAYPKPSTKWTKSDQMRFLYVGRLDASKGISVLLQAAERLAKTHSFTLKVLGDGTEREQIRRRFGHHRWLRLFGHVPLETVSNHMAESDVLCVPSIWLENSPNVVIHALSQGLPVIGSDKGGIPELVLDDLNGKLVPAGDVAAWSDEMAAVIDDPTRLDQWRSFARGQAQLYDFEILGQLMFDFLNSMVVEDISFPVEPHRNSTMCSPNSALAIPLAKPLRS